MSALESLGNKLILLQYDIFVKKLYHLLKLNHFLTS